MKKLSWIFCLLLPTIASAAYPPFAEDAFYINEILSNREVVDKLGILNRIDSITRKGETFSISSGRCVLEITIIPEQTSGPILPSPVGAHQLEIGKVICAGKK